MGVLWVLASTTYREAVLQPLYHIVLWLGSALLLLAHPFTQFYFNQEQYAVREVALATISLSGVVLSILSACLVITREIDKLTVLTIFSKPVGRGTFLFGKFLGIVWATGLGMLFLYIVFLFTAWFLGEGLHSVDEAIADPRVFVTHGQYIDPVGAAVWLFWAETGVPMLKAVLLAFDQACILTAVAVSLAVHLPLVLTASVSFLFYIFGHLWNFLYLSFPDSPSRLLHGLGVAMYCLLPNLTNLNMASIISSPHAVAAVDFTWGYVGLSAGYAAAYVLLVFALAVGSFERRDVTA
ncbi:MAG: hypothetical protein HYY93_16020 [Planctomycetes bacterium]|nr:hypothetical protein [Planctomycetota bacterium]